MWKLKAPSSELVEWYKKKMLDGLCKRIKKTENGIPKLEQRIQDILIPKNADGEEDKSVLEHLLTDKPVELHTLCDKLMKQIIPNYDEHEFEDYIKAKNKGEHRNVAEIALFQKYSDILEKLIKAFDYEGQLSRNKSRSYKLSMEQGHNTCTYCNRQYVITVNGKNDEERIARPQLDHWFSKELYPLMSLSIYNLIPCCSICNSSIKGNTIFSLSTHIHPYLDTTPEEPKFNFSYKLEENGKYKVICENVTDPKEKNMIDAFELEKIYSDHGELEVKDILLFKYQNADSYLKYLINGTLAHYGYSERDIYRMFFSAEMDSVENLDRPFSKLKRDILKQLEIIKDGHFQA